MREHNVIVCSKGIIGTHLDSLSSYARHNTSILVTSFQVPNSNSYIQLSDDPKNTIIQINKLLKKF